MNSTKWLSAFFPLLLSCYVHAQKQFTGNPDSAAIHYEDIRLFWQVFDKTSPGFDAGVFQEEYLDAGSDGLKGFIKMRIESGKNLSKTIKKDLDYYQQVRAGSLALEQSKDSLFYYLRKMKAIIPAAVFPDVYFVIGAKNTGGTTFRGGLIIGAEMFGKQTETFSPRLNIDLINPVVIHELVHYQQNYAADKSLLAQCIREGAADFLCELVAGNHSNKAIYTWGNEHEKELWTEFYSNRQNTNWSPWLYYNKDRSRPQDLGYWVGYKIVQAYYDIMPDHQQAISDILNISNFEAFLEKSGYKG